MLKEILKDDFMDCRKVFKICENMGMTKFMVRAQKKIEGIKTVQVVNRDGDQMWLWFDPEQIWEKYND